MGRKKGSKNILHQPEAVALSDSEKIDLIANLLLELVIDEFATEQEALSCKTD